MSLDVYIRIPPANDSVGVCSKVYPGMLKFVVTELFWDSMLSESNISTFFIGKLRNIFRSSMNEKSEDMLRCSLFDKNVLSSAWCSYPLF